MSDHTVAIIVEYKLTELRLPTMRSELVALATEARGRAWSHLQFLDKLADAELAKRRERSLALRIRQAGFPELKTLEQIDWSAMSGVSSTALQALATGQFVREARDVVLAGPVGTGKTHLAIALGLKAAANGYRVLFIRAADLVRDLQEAQGALALAALHRRLARAQLLILDELGFVPFTAAGGELLFGVLTERHGHDSTLVTTNLAFGEWVQVFGSEKLTTALLDRLCFNAEIFVTSGPSFRTRGRLLPPNQPPADSPR